MGGKLAIRVKDKHMRKVLQVVAAISLSGMLLGCSTMQSTKDAHNEKKNKNCRNEFTARHGLPAKTRNVAC